MGASLDSEPSLRTGGAAAAGLGPGERDTVAGRYRLIELIASGGMGSVYRAEHLLSRKKLALKVVHPYLCKGRQGVERFRREVSAAAEIDHPGIVQVYDAGVDEDGGFFMAMELLEGESLGDLLRRQWPGMATSVNMVLGMLEPLAKAHAKDFVHRDLKPDNVFLAKTEDGRERVKILDFGLAREVSKGGPTRTGTTFGTPEYMSPEQAISARQVRAPGDVWSIGVMLYELLSGEHPFSGETPNAIMANAIKEPHPPLAQKAPHVPAPLAQLIERTLAKKPEDRPQNAGEMLDEMRAVLAQLTLDETVPSCPNPPDRWNASEEGLVSSERDSLELEIEMPVVKSAAPTASQLADKLEKGGTQRAVWLAGGVVAMLVVLGGVAGAYWAISADDEPMIARGERVEEPPPPAIDEEPPPLPEPVAEVEPQTTEPVAPEPVVVDPQPEPAARERRRPVAPAIQPLVGPTALEEARACLTRNDRQCARDILAARGRSQSERALLIDLYRELGQTPQMLDAMERFVRQYPRAPQVESYRNDLRRYGRI
jgi:serine/threonine protein kinase